VRFIISHLAKQPEVLATHRGALLSLYVEHVLGSKERISAAALAGWSSLAAVLTHEDLVSTFLPAVQRMVKRSPDSALPSVALFLGALELDMSGYVKDLVALLLQQCRHAKDSVRCGHSGFHPFCAGVKGTWRSMHLCIVLIP